MFVPTTDSEKREMLEAIGVDCVEELFQSIPPSLRFPGLRGLPPPAGELEVFRHVQALAEGNRPLRCFAGAGAYDHYIPSAVWALAMRGEFATAYTPYQAEANQGALQALYEFQSLVCELLGTEVANASLYDGASALAEAVLMALRHHPERRKVLYSQGIHPQSLQTLKTYAANLEVEWVPLPLTPEGTTDLNQLRQKLSEEVACVLLQHPNFFGCLEEVEEVCHASSAQGALSVVSTYPVALGLLRPPGECGADAVVAEGQSLGIPLSFGGPYLGLFGTRQALLRRIPGRICGMTADLEGSRSFVLTLQAREQHIRRERATSNICTNEALCALAASIFLALLGPQGLRELAELNFYLAHRLARRLERLPGFRLRYATPFFNEFVLDCPVPAGKLHRKMRAKGYLAGVCLDPWFPKLKNSLLLCATETRTEQEQEEFCAELKRCL